MYDVEHISGKLQFTPDALSRGPDLVSSFKRMQFTDSDIIRKIKEAYNHEEWSCRAFAHFQGMEGRN